MIKKYSSLNPSINKCNNFFEDKIKQSIQPINARALIFTSLPKIHKNNIPIRPLYSTWI